MAGDAMVIRGQTWDAVNAERDELRAENERLRAALRMERADAHEIERLRASLLQARDSVAGEIVFQRVNHGPWIPADPDDPLVGIVEKIDAVLSLGGDNGLIGEIERLRAVADAAIAMYEHRETSDRAMIDTLGDWLEARDALYAAVEALGRPKNG